MTVELTENSQPLGKKPSELVEGQFLELTHAGVFYGFDLSYGHLDLIIGKFGAEGEDVTAIRFNDGSGLGPEHADVMWRQLTECLDEIQNLGEPGDNDDTS